jgi:uncharacterized membrane protein YhaH (DUF805 family)
MESNNPYQSPLAKNSEVEIRSTKRSLCWLFLSFEGRIPRRTFWIANAALFLIPNVIALILGFFIRNWVQAHEPKSDLTVFLLIAIFGFPWGFMYFAIQAKRWHDRNKSTFWILLVFLLLVGMIWMLIELGFLKGTNGPNRYGADPRAITSPRHFSPRS